MVCYDRIFGRDATIWNLRVQKKIQILRKSPLKLSKLSSYQCILLIKNVFFLNIFIVGNVHNIFMERDLYVIS